MSAKAEISWNRTDENGEKVQIYARHFSKSWRFHSRHKRYDKWLPIENPPLDDWLELLDAVRRRVGRRLLKPNDLRRLEQTIRERFPEAAI